MKFFNPHKKMIIMVGPYAVKPLTITREFTAREVEEDSKLAYALDKKHLIEVPKSMLVEPEKEVVEKKAPEMTVEANPKNKPVQTKDGVSYIMANDESEAPDMIIANDPNSPDRIENSQFDTETPDNMAIAQTKESPDYIIDASAGEPDASVSDIIEDQSNKENDDATFDDNVNLADNEEENEGSMDADKAIEADSISHFLKKNGREGSVETTVKVEMTKDMEAAKEVIQTEGSKGLENSEKTNKGTDEVKDFLQKPFFSKKKIIAGEKNVAFLKEVNAATSADTVKKLIKQRLSELG